MKGLPSQQTGQQLLCYQHYGYCSHPESLRFQGSKLQHSDPTMVQVIDLSWYPGKRRLASDELQQMETARSERQSQPAPTAEAPPTAWQSRTPRSLKGFAEKPQRPTLLEAVSEI